jgi:1,4-dihydroxy-2-naphthoate octaprenyltransferase
MESGLAEAVSVQAGEALGEGAGEGVGVLAEMGTVLDGRSALCWVLMLLCAVLLQSAVNTLNDYQDFKSGLDTAETIRDETDASLVYNQINPRSALAFALVLLGLAAALGTAVVLLTSLWLLVPAAVAAAAVCLYSAGPKPISSLPLGEVVSGIVMGGVLTCVCFYAVTLSFSSAVVALAVVPTVAIAQIMLTNNTCDTARDRAAGRRTLPLLLGVHRSRVLNGALGVFAFLWLGLFVVGEGLAPGLIVVLLGLALCLPKLATLLKGPYSLENRRVMMHSVVSYNRLLDASACVALLAGGVARAIF